MATAVASQLKSTDHSVADYFQLPEQQRQRAEDRSAWWAVCTVLLTVVSTGVFGMALTVLWVLSQTR